MESLKKNQIEILELKNTTTYKMKLSQDRFNIAEKIKLEDRA